MNHTSTRSLTDCWWHYHLGWRHRTALTIGKPASGSTRRRRASAKSFVKRDSAAPARTAVKAIRAGAAEPSSRVRRLVISGVRRGVSDKGLAGDTRVPIGEHPSGVALPGPDVQFVEG